MEYKNFLIYWDIAFTYLSYLSIVISVLLFIIFKVQYLSKKSYKEKYDYLAKKEIKNKTLLLIILGIAIFSYVNTIKSNWVALLELYLFIRFFIASCIILMITLISYLLFKYIHPGILKKKLDILRYAPRINPKTGNKMKLLTEEEEDVHLDEGMQAEEKIFSVDYDVWIDEKTKDTIIEKYPGVFENLKCDRCGFVTLKLFGEAIVNKGYNYEGFEFGSISQHIDHNKETELMREYHCVYCNKVKRKFLKYSNVKEDDTLVKEEKLAIKIAVSRYGIVNTYEFDTVENAKNFLETI